MYLGEVVSSASNIAVVQKFMECFHLKIVFFDIDETIELRFEKADAIGLSWMDESFF